MSYCTVAQVRNRNVSTLKDTAVSDSKILEYIAYAEGVVDGYLCQRYPVPLTSVSALITGITADFAAGLALRDETGDRGEDDEPKQALYLRRGSEDLLKKIASGSMGLSSNTNSATSKTTSYGETGKFENWDITDYSTYED